MNRPTRTSQLRHFAPLAGFVLPTVVIGYGVVIPRSCIAGWNELTLGFAATVVGACLTLLAGLRLVARDAREARWRSLSSSPVSRAGRAAGSARSSPA